MDYKKRYEEIIRSAKDAKISTSDQGFLKWIDDTFPELAESKDEKIRKEIIEYFKKYNAISLGGFSTVECISWLEKQKKPSKWSEHQHKLLNYAMSMTDDTEVKKFLESLRNQPIQKQEWSEEDENTRNKIIGSLDALKFYVERNNEFDKEQVESNLRELDEEIKWMQDIVPQQKQNLKPQSRWKPTKKQLETLSRIRDYVSSNSAYWSQVIDELLVELENLYDEDAL